MELDEDVLISIFPPMELLRDGDRLAQHSGRFSDNGSYATTLSFFDYIIFDCRTTYPRDPHPGAHLYILLQPLITMRDPNATLRFDILRFRQCMRLSAGVPMVSRRVALRWEGFNLSLRSGESMVWEGLHWWQLNLVM